jgi:tetratricopeptide (TPR) repeat protein
MISKRAAGLAGALVVFAGVSLAAITTIEGTVNGDDGQPLKEAVIKLERQDIKGSYHTKTDKKGKYYYGGLGLGVYNVCVEVDGKQRDCVNKVHTTTEKPIEVNFDLKRQHEDQETLAKAAEAGTLTKEQEKQLTPEQRAALKAHKDELAQVQQHNRALNDAYNTGMTALNCGKKPATCAATAPSDPANPQSAAQPMTAGAYFEQAVAAFKKAGETDPKQEAIWSHLAEAQTGLAGTQMGPEAQATLTAALESYEKSIALKPSDPAVHNNYALALARLKRFPEASAELKKAAEFDPPGAGKYYYNLGALLVNAGQYDEAAETFKKAIELTPSYAEAHFQYAVCLSSKMTVTADGKTVAPPEMKGELDKYLELAPQGPNAEAAQAMLAALGGQVQTQYVNPNAPPAKKPTKRKP